MTLPKNVDVVIAGGGIAGSILGGTLARAGVDVLVAEKDEHFRDRIRGEGIYPWGLDEVGRLGVAALFDGVEAAPMVGLGFYEGQQLAKRFPWEPGLVDDRYALGFSHPRMQEAAWAWAQAGGARMSRPTKVVDCTTNGAVTVTVAHGDSASQIRARLVVGADGKLSRARNWTGGGSAGDPENHRFGGVQVSGVRTDDRDTDNVAGSPGAWVNWFAQGPATTRLYLAMPAEKLRATGADRSFDALVAFAAGHLPAGALDDVRQEGPMGFFANNDTWATRIAGDRVTLVGDAAGSPDPSQGHGTSLAFRDVRELSDLLLADDDWPAAIDEYGRRRAGYYDVIHQFDRWSTIVENQVGPDADRQRAGHDRAEAADPLLGGFACLVVRGPDGLVADEAARAHFFGEDLT